MREEEAKEHALEMALWLGAIAARGPVTVRRLDKASWYVRVLTEDRYDVIPPRPAVEAYGISLLTALRRAGQRLAVVIP